MSSSTSFLLQSSSSSSSALPDSPALSLLPFSLGPNSAPYTSNSAPLSSYFKPRPNPNGSNSVIAAFRGRSVVGQEIDIPKGWKGIILSTSKRPDKGGIEIHSDQFNLKSTPTPNPKEDQENARHDDGLQLRRTTRQSSAPGGRNVNGKVKGEGQIALSKPKIRTSGIVIRQSKKRYRFDSDDEEEEGEQKEEENQLSRTPSKRSRLIESGGYITPQKSSISYTTVKNDEESYNYNNDTIIIPEIIIQEATPLKNPLPTPKKRLNERKSSPTPESKDRRSKNQLPEITESLELVEKEIQFETSDPFINEESNEFQISNQMNFENNELINEINGSLSKETIIKVEEEHLIPSPSTENDLPNFEFNTKSEENENMTSSIKNELNPLNEFEEQEENYEGPIRLLKPISKFDKFILYTPDDPLIGFRSEELSINEIEKQKDKDQSIDTKDTIQVRRSWWRSGGSGEGGDEFIRGLGEFLGLMENLNKPVYLDDLEDDDEDD
ncbi:uncharacterized protein I206_103520 [Kwoniella pini CBS 10737]|uniref:Uncharacterized protein n=1 Tax=Kwoniella pini CBS 10737 TaxID=1296096 RepID=A0A1B9I9W6_9TREE|nr:uncharacterized protein I206_01476 [Kwoniella pini CBS 10737]OCF52191.1 hypothetical protein I206_01476 [Kwoniella pini CBS 10737]